ncbi:DivIVA domain-containing protein [Planosporangium thailandense]|uniref:Cell wall synthesis protein Wag31 n=1 Tax=Planosporangium thailandense TaxID=765197 RepID=A0ABX0Y3V4_9ACTN|nr:DivIVA domain-containing protein [Planosporangium thailandense]NJC73033.1 DivIVA domain-containing protein [Planosporangium thailandense]
MSGQTSDHVGAASTARFWRPLSPDQIRQHAFGESGFGRRGYRPDEVDLFIDQVAAEVERWGSAYAAAADEIARLRNYFRDNHIDPEATAARQESTEAITVLTHAQTRADQLIADAQAHAKAIVASARQEADRVRAGAAFIASRDQAERLTALSRSILATVDGATTQLDAASARVRTTTDAFAAELAALTGPWTATSYVGRATASMSPTVAMSQAGTPALVRITAWPPDADPS